MEGDTPDFNVFHFSFLDDTLPNWEKEIELSDTELLSCAEAQVNEAIETTTRFPRWRRIFMFSTVRKQAKSEARSFFPEAQVRCEIPVF